MTLTEEVQLIIGKPESVTLEYKAVLPPSRSIAQIICSFANTNGGVLLLGVFKHLTGKIEVNGLSEDFHANSITHKAMDLLSPTPHIEYEYVQINNKKLYAIKTHPSKEPVSIEGKIYIRTGAQVKLSNPQELVFKIDAYSGIKRINEKLKEIRSNSTNAKLKLIEHYGGVLKMFDDLGSLLYPEDAEKPTEHPEGKILTRILFTSCVDTFETYLSDLLYEIFLANPATLKSNQQVTIEEVLNCTDLQEFVNYWAKQKLNKLQKGSVKGFIKDNKQIKDLNALDSDQQDEIEAILQIRHLYSHRNGIVDEKFLQYYNDFPLNTEHRLSMESVCEKLRFLVERADEIDTKAVIKYQLAESTI